MLILNSTCRVDREFTGFLFTGPRTPRPRRATSSPPCNKFVRLNVAAAEESGSMSTEPAEPVSAHLSPAGMPTSPGGPGVEGPADSSLVGVFALRYPSGLAGPPEFSGVTVSLGPPG